MVYNHLLVTVFESFSVVVQAPAGCGSSIRRPHQPATLRLTDTPASYLDKYFIKFFLLLFSVRTPSCHNHSDVVLAELLEARNNSVSEPMVPKMW